ELVDLFQERMSPYGGVAGEVAAQITDPDQIDFRALTWMIVPPPWHAGRVVLLGDAAHTTTPHLAFGVGLAIEDAVVLAELVSHGVGPAAVGQPFAQRRFERGRLVVAAPLQLSRWEQEQGLPNPQTGGLIRGTFAELAEPI